MPLTRFTLNSLSNNFLKGLAYNQCRAQRDESEIVAYLRYLFNRISNYVSNIGSFSQSAILQALNVKID